MFLIFIFLKVLLFYLKVNFTERGLASLVITLFIQISTQNVVNESKQQMNRTNFSYLLIVKRTDLETIMLQF